MQRCSKTHPFPLLGGDLAPKIGVADIVIVGNGDIQNLMDITKIVNHFRSMILSNVIKHVWSVILAGLISTASLWGGMPSFAPLNAHEIEIAARLLREGGHLHELSEIATLTLIEPAKQQFGMLGRQARAVMIDHLKGKSFEVDVDVTAGKAGAPRPIRNGQPLETFSEFTSAAEIIRKDAQWQAAVRRRGITNFDEVYVTVWAGGHHRPKSAEGRRYGRGLAYHSRGQTNQQGPPIEGLEAIVDLNEKRVVQVIDTGVRTIARESSDFFNPEVRGTNRPALKPLLVVQPEGPSFESKDFEVSWDNWRFGWSFNQREGLVLHRVRYQDGGQERSILHRASISEMLVPYGSTDQTWFWRNAVDQGEYGLGACASELMPGQTAPPNAAMFNVVVSDSGGVANIWTNRVFLFERMGESLWSHADLSGATIGRMSRELAIGFIATVGNYDYRYTWTFRQDGVIEFQAGMTGVLLMAGTDLERCASCEGGVPAPGTQKLSAEERFGTLVAKNTIAVNHQHFINVRLDFDIDGTSNSVKEVNTQLLRGRGSNPHGNAWQAAQTIFGREREARRNVNPATHRHWVVLNPNHRTELGHFPSYALEPSASSGPIMRPSSPSRRLLGFVNRAFHATRFKPNELFAGGDYPNQVQYADNVETWGNDNETIHNEDVVAWYTLGMTHIPRPEEFPVMPTAHTGFRLVPKGFFTRNPALNVPE